MQRHGSLTGSIPPLQQFIVDSQKQLEGIVVDHHGGSSLRYFFLAAKQAFRVGQMSSFVDHCET
jgi:hypothetical protein